MGSLMAKQLMDKGHLVTEYDLDKQAVNDLVKQGAKKAKHVAEIGATCKQVFTMLPTPEIIAQTSTGPDGLLSKYSSPTVLIDSSTIDSATAQSIHAAAS